MKNNKLHNDLVNIDDMIYNSENEEKEEIEIEKIEETNVKNVRKDSQISKNSQENKTKEEDLRSVFVKNLDYNCTKEEIKIFFEEAGPIERVTILFDKFYSTPKGTCYIEYKSVESKEKSFKLSEKLLKGKKLEILSKRTNIPFKNKKKYKTNLFNKMKKMIKPYMNNNYHKKYN